MSIRGARSTASNPRSVSSPAITGRKSTTRIKARRAFLSPYYDSGIDYFFAPFFAFASFFAALAAFFVAFLSTPPGLEHAPRPLVADVVPSLQIVEAAGPWALLTENAAVVTAIATVYRHFLNENTFPP